MDAWLQVKVCGRGLGLRPIGCTPAPFVTQKRRCIAVVVVCVAQCNHSSRRQRSGAARICAVNVEKWRERHPRCYGRGRARNRHKRRVAGSQLWHGQEYRRYDKPTIHLSRHDTRDIVVSWRACRVYIATCPSSIVVIYTVNFRYDLDYLHSEPCQ